MRVTPFHPGLLVFLLTTLALNLGIVSPCDGGDRSGSSSGPAGVLTLAEALRLARAHNPSLAAADLGVQAAIARQKQAGLWPNPELELESEDMGGPGELSGLRSAAVTTLLSQEIPVAGKLRHRRAAAGVERDLAVADLAVARLHVETMTTLRFRQVQLAEEQVALAEELAELARALLETVTRRVEAGKVSPVEATRARAHYAGARVEVVRAGHELDGARTRLAACWGGEADGFGRVTAGLPSAVGSPPLAVLQAKLSANPEMQRITGEVRRAEMAARMARADALPGLTVSAGPRRLREAGITTWVAALSVPLPLFDRNQGERRAAELEVEQARKAVESLRQELTAELAAAVSELAALAAELEALQGEMIPAVREAVEATRLGYEEGKFGFLEVLHAQQTMSEAKRQQLAALGAYVSTQAGIEHLVGGSLSGRLGEIPELEARPTSSGTAAGTVVEAIGQGTPGRAEE